MDDKDSIKKNKTPKDRIRPVKNVKRIIILIAIILVIIPTILCIFLFNKIGVLQKQIDMLMIKKYGTIYVGMNHDKSHVAEAASSKEGNSNTFDNEKETKKSNDKNIDNNKGQVGDKDGNPTSDFKVDQAKTSQSKKEEETHINSNGQKDKDSKNEESKENIKKVYLTFDDGPSKNTPKILDILKEYNVKATFFVIGKTDDFSKEMYQRIVEEGHTLGMHSFTHKYDEIYHSLDNFKEDFFKLRNFLYETTNYLPTVYRFPGGSGNKVSDLDMSVFIKFLNDQSITYYDWNVINGDATGEKLSPEEAYQNVIEGVETFNNSYVLMHDAHTKDSTVESLSRIIEALLEKEVDILPLTDDVKPVQQVRFDEINQ